MLLMAFVRGTEELEGGGSKRPFLSKRAMDLEEKTSGAPSPATVIPQSGLSPENAFLHDSLRTAPIIGKLSELDVAISNLSGVLRSIRGIQEATARRRAVLDSAVRGNLVELPDGQFAPMKTDVDRCNMLAKIFDIDQAYGECTTVFNLAVAKTMHGMQAIKAENEGAVNSLVKLS